ncbi:MAG: GTP-binding protein [Geminicoccaceae bacterium]
MVATEDHPDRPALIDGREHLIQPLIWLPTWPTADRRGRLVFVTANTSEDWIRTLLTTLSNQLKLQAMPELQLAIAEQIG